MRKIIVIGSPGSGKSTFSKRLASRLEIPVYHLDVLFWNPGWVESSREELKRNQYQLITQEKWIIDGNYRSTIDIRINAADTVILLDRSRWLCLFRVLKRRIIYRNKVRSDMGEDCPERVHPTFIKYVWKFPEDKLIPLKETLAKVRDDKNVFVLTSEYEVEQFLESLKGNWNARM
ncbi:DNA topology modulation protein [Pontibacillus yanchengensis]|uniref:DNA topology modulation protein n=3 Tax=Pontibacillus yanchengensis TaxID=462910 RepID=A0ACC7VC82_9BACI|nr:DNA topology modulation protein [Pontibacillus yanchengensis]MYL34703.1 DNA topology modulation protein [Pontibacillus yanchengensis]MYL52312.1 DNA topology modulation protein [Pontibacillus yanchengensis]